MSQCVECGGSRVAERDPSGGYALDCPCCNGSGEIDEIIHTSAPAAYDGFGTKTLAVVGRDAFNGLPVRMVAIQPEHFEWQTSRYWSGSHRVTHERCTLEDYVRLGDWILEEES